MTINLHSRWRSKAVILAAATALAASAGLAALATAPAQAASANLFASIGASGTLVTGNGVSSVTHLGTGQRPSRRPAPRSWHGAPARVHPHEKASRPS